jgi:hypothetical protein
MNYFNYRADYICDCFIGPLSSEYQFYIQDVYIANNNGVYNGLDIFKPVFNSSDYKLSVPGFASMNNVFDYIKCKGVSIKYMPFTQIRDVSTYTDKRPNLVGNIMTQSEWDNVNGAYGGAISSQGNVNDFIERPYAKIIYWQKEQNFYRKFPWNNKNYNSYVLDNNMFYKYIPLTNQLEDANLFFVMLNTSPVNTQMFNDQTTKYGPFAQLRVRVYFRFKSSRY